MIYTKNKYNDLLNQIINDSMVEIRVDKMTEMLDELGIKNSMDDIYNLILWNDNVNDMVHVVISLYEICNLSNEDCIRITTDAHNKGKSLIKKGSFENLTILKRKLNDRNLTVTIERD